MFSRLRCLLNYPLLSQFTCWVLIKRFLVVRAAAHEPSGSSGPYGFAEACNIIIHVIIIDSSWEYGFCGVEGNGHSARDVLTSLGLWSQAWTSHGNDRSI
jgi:hypothetical protein